jgi:hypothetical protein
MVDLGDEAQVKAHFSPFGYSANFYARQVHGLCRMYHYDWKIILDVPDGTPR